MIAVAFNLFWAAVFFCGAWKTGISWAGFFLFLAGIWLLCHVLIGLARAVGGDDGGRVHPHCRTVSRNRSQAA